MAGERLARERVDPALWQRPDMRRALAERDIGTVFRLLQRVGVSQRRIAALTGQSQSEISEILAGRQVVSYDVLVRIADGLGVPRGQLGLAYDETTAAIVGAHDVGDDDPRRTLARIAELSVGGAVDPQTWVEPFALAWAPPPDRVGRGDVTRLVEITGRLRAIDHEYGGGACRDAVLAQVAWAQRLLRARVANDVEREIHIAIANLHLLAGWTSFDTGLVTPARRHFTRALEHARFVEEPSLAAKALYCLGRVHVHHGWAAQAVRLFQLSQVSAQESGYGRAVAMAQVNLAWAQAVAGDSAQAVTSLNRAQEEYARTEHDEVPAWLRFFDSAELQAMRGTTLAHLRDATADQRDEAIKRFSLSAALRELPLARSRAFELTALAWLLLGAGSTDQGVQVGHQDVDLA
ncbi:MAG TPA: helix-turn-helix transcriptional regulator, partial [Micromonosporaceae bacterium]|nr:helix-turn-helix transcriptional regulator [Micromonosporaceae bacterium]